MDLLARRLTFAALVLAACGPQVAIDDGGGNVTEPAGSTDDASPPSVTSPGSGPTPATTGMGPTSAPPDTSADSIGEVDVDDGDASTGVIPDDTGCGVAPEGTSFHCTVVECDPFAQDCPAGEKCMPWANDGGAVWNSTRCTPVAPDPGQAGEACLVEGSAVSGIDDCDIGLMCFWVDSETNEGTCVPLCSGSPEDPICPDDGYCTISADSVLSLCMDTCDPLADDCAIGHCFPTHDSFVCHDVLPGDVPPGAACDFPQECSTGNTCISGRFVDGCDGVGCCASLCDLGAAEPDAPCLPGQTCISWWARGQAPEQWAHVGVCGVPQ